MANIKSAEKKARQALTKKARNQQTISAVRTVETDVRKAIASKNKPEASKLLVLYSKRIDKAAQKNMIHWKTASRKIGRLATLVAKMA